MTERKRNIRLGLALVAAIFAGIGGAAALSRGIEYVIAADIHPTITEPLENKNITPKPAKRNIEPEKRTAADPANPNAPSNRILGEYTTKFSTEPKSRNENINHAADALRGIVIAPGEVFSYNETIGPTTKDNGYKRARIFIRGKKAFGYGGGVCQVSSTLYNAAEAAGMEIVERHHHSLPVEYVPKGKDAATSYGSVDFKFKNTYSYPVKIDTGIDNNALTIQITAV